MAEFGGRSRGAFVIRDLRARVMTRSVRNPRFCLAGGERERDERGAEIVRANRRELVGIREQLASLHFGELQMCSKIVSETILVRQFAVLVTEHESTLRCLGLFLPRGKSVENTAIECARSEVVRFVFLDTHGAALQVDLLPGQGESLTRAHALACEKSVEHAATQWNGAVCQQLPILGWIQIREDSCRSFSWQGAARDRILFQDTCGINGELQHASYELSDVSLRCL